MSIYSVAPFYCPFCGEMDESNLKLQTPLCDDGLHHDAYMRCFSCGARGPYVEINLTPEQVGNMLVAPVIDKWNTRVGLEKVHKIYYEEVPAK